MPKMKANTFLVASVAATVLALFEGPSASAAQFKPTTGGDLDDPNNWTSTTDTAYGVVKQQSAPLTISSASATMPNNGNLLYRTNVHTNEFGAGYVLNIPFLTVEQGATLVHRSGAIAISGGSNQSKIGPSASSTGTLVVTGADASISFATMAATVGTGSAFSILGGASLELASKIYVGAGASFMADGASVSLTQNGSVLEVAQGAACTFADSSLAMANGAQLLVDSGATATVSRCSISPGGDASKIGGSGGAVRFTGGTTTINHRFEMMGDGFVFFIDGATVDFSSSGWFITGSSSATDSQNPGNTRTIRFSGASPRLSVAGGSGFGFYLRGTAITFRFDLGADWAPSAPVVEITDGGKFSGDAACRAASQVVVNIDNDCPPGTYTLLKGKAATTILTGEGKWVANCGSAREAEFQTAGSVGTTSECLQIVVRDAAKATVICFR